MHVVDMARTKQSARRSKKNPPKFAKIAWLHRTEDKVDKPVKPPKTSWKAWTNKTGQTKPFPEWVFSVKKPPKITWERWNEAQEKLALAQNKKPKQ